MADDDRMRQAALSSPGVSSLRRPIIPADADAGTADAGSSDAHAPAEFDLHYVRTGPRGTTPVVVIPGGPGLASVLPYRGFRKRAIERGLDVIMVEHRGVGLSRCDRSRRDLPPESLTVAAVVDDLDAVLEAESVCEAVIVGSSYGTYLAQAFAAAHPSRVAALLVESPMLSTDARSDVSGYQRALLYDGATQEDKTVGDSTTRALAAQVRGLVAAGDHDELALGDAVRIVYEFAGPAVLRRFLEQLERGRAPRTWGLLTKASSTEITQRMPYRMEFDLVAEIAFRELGYAEGPDDGRIFDSGHAFRELGEQYSPYAGESYDLASALPGSGFPVLAMVGERDLRTPRPVAERIAELAPRGRLVVLPEHGHSALDTHVEPLLAAAATMAEWSRSADDVESAATAALKAAEGRRRGGPSRHLGLLLSVLLWIDRMVPRLRRS